MNLEELKALKEKSDRLVETLKNDREVLKQTKEVICKDNTKDLRTFLESLRDYAELIPKSIRFVEVNTYGLFKQFDKHRYGGFWSDDTWLRISETGLHFLCSNGDEEYFIDIDKDKATIGYPEHHHYYSSRYYEDFKVFLLDHKEEIKAYIEEGLEQVLAQYVESNKEQNDALYADVTRLNR